MIGRHTIAKYYQRGVKPIWIFEFCSNGSRKMIVQKQDEKINIKNDSKDLECFVSMYEATMVSVGTMTTRSS